MAERQESEIEGRHTERIRAKQKLYFFEFCRRGFQNVTLDHEVVCLLLSVFTLCNCCAIAISFRVRFRILTSGTIVCIVRSHCCFITIN